MASPLRLTERNSTRPGVAATARSIGSATNRLTSVAAASGYSVRMVSTGSVTSGSSETGIRPNDTEPSRTTPNVAAMVLTGRLIAAEVRDIWKPDVGCARRRFDGQ